jgi:hypothetical protein
MLHNESRLDDTPIVVWSPAAGHSFDLTELTQYLSETKERLSSQLDEHGGVMLRGFNCIHSSDDYQKILDVIAPDLMEYVGGTTPRKVVNGRIMTATEIPGEYSIPLHQEMSYTNNSPDRIAFFCEIPAAEGGETRLDRLPSLPARQAVQPQNLQLPSRPRMGSGQGNTDDAGQGPQAGNPSRD